MNIYFGQSDVGLTNAQLGMLATIPPSAYPFMASMNQHVQTSSSPTFSNLILNSGTLSTSTTTGALRVSGGVGISEKLNCGDVIKTSKNIIVYDNYSKRSGYCNKSLGIQSVNQFTSRVEAVANSWRSICWSPELGIFCAVSFSGTNDRVMTSVDGILWTSRTTPNLDWNKVCWASGLGLFCAVANTGSGDRVMTSPDGINWTTRVSSVDNRWTAVCWSPELNLLCAVSNGTGSGNRVMTSPNGIDWTTRVSAADNSWGAVCWSSELGLFCAVAYVIGVTNVMTSPNGIDWTTQTCPSGEWRDVCWSSELGLFCAVGASGSSNRTMTSPDAINWTVRTHASSNSWKSITWASELGLFAAVATGTDPGANNRLMTSPDGVTWTARQTASNVSWESICWSPELGLFAAIASSGAGNLVMTSRRVYNYPYRPRPYYKTETGCVAFGDNSMTLNTGNFNTAVGARALRDTTSGQYNTSFGYNANATGTINSNNTSFGANTLSALTTGSGNTVFGTSAGGIVQSGSNNILVGYNSKTSAVDSANAIAIGYDTEAATNQTVIGNSSTTATKLYGDVSATLGLTSSVLKPAIDGTTALSLMKSDGTTPVISLDTTNTRVSINQTLGTETLSVNGNARLEGNIKTNIGNQGHLFMRTGDVNRWVFGMEKVEAGTNSGGNLYFGSYSDIGGSLAVPLKIKRSNGFVGLGLTTAEEEPTVMLDVNGAINASVSTISDVFRSYVASQYGANIGASVYLCRKARGTASSKTDILTNDYIGGIGAYGWKNTNWRDGSSILFRCESLGASSIDSNIIFNTTQGGSIYERMRLDASGLLTVSGLSSSPTLAANTSISILRTGYARYHVYNNGANSEWMFGQKPGATSHNFFITRSSGSVETDILTLGTTGGATLDGSVDHGYSISRSSVSVGGLYAVANTNSYFTGTVANDLAIRNDDNTKTIHIGTGSVNPTLKVTLNNCNVIPTADSSSTITGALTVAGGVGVSKNLNVGGQFNIVSGGGASDVIPFNITAASLANGKSLIQRFGKSSADGDNAFIAFIKQAAVSDTLLRMSIWGATGNLDIYGGDGRVNMSCTTDSTSISTGALVVSGGLGVAKNIYVGTVPAVSLGAQHKQVYWDSTSKQFVISV